MFNFWDVLCHLFVSVWLALVVLIATFKLIGLVIFLLGHVLHHTFGANAMHMKFIICIISHVVLFFCVVVLGKLSGVAFSLNTFLSNVPQMTTSQLKTKAHRLTQRVSNSQNERFVIAYPCASQKSYDVFFWKPKTLLPLLSLVTVLMWKNKTTDCSGSDAPSA